MKRTVLVVAILLIVVCVALVYYSVVVCARGAVSELRTKQWWKVQHVQTSVNAFHREYGVWPATLSQLLTTNNVKRMRFVLDDDLLDPWRTPLRYLPPSDTGDGVIVSLGADRKEGGHGLAADFTVSVRETRRLGTDKLSGPEQ